MASDSQAVVKASRFSRPKAGHWLLANMHRCLEAQDTTSLARKRERQLVLSWVPGHRGVIGNEAADRAAKEAARGRSSLAHELPLKLAGLDIDWQLKRLPASASARRRAHTEGLKTQWERLFRRSPRYARYRSVDPSNTPSKLRQQLLSLPRASASIIIQLRTGHAPLNRHLHRINRHEHPTCDACGAAPESVRHYLLECTSYRTHREHMLHSLGRGFDRLDRLLSTTKGIAATLKYIAATGRFNASHDLTRALQTNPTARAPPRAPQHPA